MVRISRVSRSGDKVILKSSAGYGIFSTTSDDVVAGDFESLVASGSWRRPIEGDAEAFAAQIDLADGAIVASTAPKAEKPRLYRAPKNVRQEIATALKEFSALIPDSDREIASRISQGPVSKSDIEWMYTFFSQVDKALQLRGGKYGKRWAEKICAVVDPMTASVSPFDDEELYYYGISDTPLSKDILALVAVDPATQQVFDWVMGEWVLSENESLADIDEPYILPLDGETAAGVATWLNQQPEENPFGYNVYDHDYVERNLFELAAPEIDFEELDRIAAVVADATGYSAPERSVNAKRQNRGPGGKFGGGSNPPSKHLTTFNKARLPNELPLVESPADRINEWLAEFATVTASAATTSDAMYFAIVDEVDKTAVMDVVAIRRTAEDTPEAYVRREGEWQLDNDVLADLRGSTPPPVVEIDTEETVKTVLAQIDADEGVSEETPDDVSSSESIKQLSTGFSFADGSLEIRNAKQLKEAVDEVGLTASIEQIAHIRKRAKALNRLDVVPEDWRKPSIVDEGILASAVSPLFGEYGEIVAAGIPGVADAPSDFAAVARLRNYWTRGKGALKIRWGTPGDLTRAHRYLAKYVGPGRAWGLAQKWHQSLYGVSNTTHDKATGQYRPRRRKR